MEAPPAVPVRDPRRTMDEEQHAGSDQYVTRDFEKGRTQTVASRDTIPNHQTRSKDESTITAISTHDDDVPRQTSPMYQHDNHTATNTTMYSESKSLTNKNVKLADHLSIIVGPPIVLLLDLIVPCAIYYSWLHIAREKWRKHGEIGPRPVYNEHVLGLSVAAFGIGELYILLVRVVRLIKDHDGCAPLLSKHKWELDATCWVYGTALLVALAPFLISTLAKDEVIPWLYIYSPGALMAFLGLVAIITLLPIRLPIRINDDPKGSRIKPILYYAAEDFISVDNFQGRKFRKRFRQRYEANPKIRTMILHLTLFWIGGICLYLGCIGAIIWSLEFEIAWGLSLGVMFMWILTWAGSTGLWVRTVVEREKDIARREKSKRLSAVMEERLSMMMEDVNRPGSCRDLENT